MKAHRIAIGILFLILPILQTFAQENLIVPKATENAYKNETRQRDGNPGKNYWQNSTDYNIDVVMDVENMVLKGEEEIAYYNNSPDSLSVIVIRLYQDLFKKGANRNSIVDIDPIDIHDGVNVSKLMVNGSKVELSGENSPVQRTGTIMIIHLAQKLAPNTDLKIQIDWDFNFPQYSLIRMGTIDSTSLFVGQWYPQVAVYDDVNGWDARSYNGMAEFYNDFSNFNVNITVPKNFMVWATGELVNMKEVLQAEYYEKYQKATASEEISHVITEEDLKKGKIFTKNTTWSFKAENVTDFAFGISDHYLWDVCSVEVDKKTKRRTIIGVAYNKDAQYFDKVAEISRETVRSLSEEMPGVPYPFPYLTVYNGDFGMEYPMITNVGADESYAMTVYANSHEIAHAYFPFLVGTNETKNGWIDEGFTVFLPEAVQTRLSSDLDIAKSNTFAFAYYSGIDGEPALITPTYYLDVNIYFYLNYAKTEPALRLLQMELGDEVFMKCLHAFIDRWKYKHPTPYDMFNTFSDVSEQDLNWYWQAWYFQSGGIPDMAINSVKKVDVGYEVIVENKGNFPLPVVLSFYNGETLVKTITEPAAKWKGHKKTIKINSNTTENITKITLGTAYIPDANQGDNVFVVE
ncbi:MAG: M1 family metallopeptidase [Bacteroidales bacterium]|nr:M1 family metallopeptidase [Bacteroidales bacterium]